jgi:hypothetical protein
MNLLTRIKKLEEKYLTNKVEAPKFIIRFIDPLNQNKALNKLSNNGVIYEKIPNESEDEFTHRIAGLSKETLIFECD